MVWDEDRSRNVNHGDERIPGLTVVAYKDGKEIARTTTDENSSYKFDGLEPGEYGIAVYGPDGGQLFFEDKVATVVAGREDTGNDRGFVKELPAPVQDESKAPQESASDVRRVLATTGVDSNVVLGLGVGVLALLVLAAVVRRKKGSSSSKSCSIRSYYVVAEPSVRERGFPWTFYTGHHVRPFRADRRGTACRTRRAARGTACQAQKKAKDMGDPLQNVGNLVMAVHAEKVYQYELQRRREAL